MSKKNSVAVSEPAKDAEKKPHVERKTFKKMLRCELTEAEILLAGRAMAQAQQDGQLAKQELASVSKDLKAKVEQYSLLANRAGNLVINRYEYKEVPVEKVCDFDRKLVTETRTDTGAVIDKRPMSPEESQMGLGIEQPE